MAICCPQRMYCDATVIDITQTHLRTEQTQTTRGHCFGAIWKNTLIYPVITAAAAYHKPLAGNGLDV